MKAWPHELPNINVRVICSNCGKTMKMRRFEWLNGIVLIEAEGCSCVYNERMEKFNEELSKIIQAKEAK